MFLHSSRRVSRITNLAIFFGVLLVGLSPRGATASPEQPAPSQGGSEPMSGATFAVRMRDIQSRVDEEKEQTRRNRARLALLSDSMPTGGKGSATANVIFHNEVTSDFRLVRAVFQLDADVRYDKSDDTGALAAQTDIPIFNGAIMPGDHTLQAVLVFRGNGFGVFTYLRGYKLEVKSSHAFTVSAGQPVKVIATGVQTGGATTPIQDRLALRWKIEAAPSAAAVAAASRIDPSDADPSILAELRAALSPYGAWIEDATFGTVWVPSASIVGHDFVPFVTGGHWTYDGVAGVDADFAWISDYDWGWAPFHLGRWVFGSSGWSWIPGRAYAPSWVTWRIENESRGAQGHVGWAPTPPTFVWRNGAAVRVDPPALRFVYVPANEVFATPLPSHVAGSGQSGAIESSTQIYTPAAGAIAHAPSLPSMGVTVSPVRTAVGETSLVRARDFSRRGTLAEVAPTAVATTTGTSGASSSTTANAVDASGTSAMAAIDPADADPSVLSDARTQLSAYGSWTDDPTYGTVWTPSPQIVGASFVPYETGGHWTYERSREGTDEGGDYVWISDWSWGWAPFHYGRWVRAATGWSWVPGHTYAPAWVEWRTGDKTVGWAPAPPTFGWKGGVAVRVEVPQPPPFVFVASADVFAPNLAARAVPSTGVVTQRVVRAPAPSSLGIRVAPRPPLNDPGLARARVGFVRAAPPVTVTPARPPVTVTPIQPPVTTVGPQGPSVTIQLGTSPQAPAPVHTAAPPQRRPRTPAAPTTSSSVRTVPTAAPRPRQPRR